MDNIYVVFGDQVLYCDMCHGKSQSGGHIEKQEVSDTSCLDLKTLFWGSVF